VVFHNGPEPVLLDLAVLMGKDIPLSDDGFPGNGRLPGLRLVGYFASGFSNNFEGSFDSHLGLSVAEILLIGCGVRKTPDRLRGVEHVPEISLVSFLRLHR